MLPLRRVGGTKGSSRGIVSVVAAFSPYSDLLPTVADSRERRHAKENWLGEERDRKGKRHVVARQ